MAKNIEQHPNANVQYNHEVIDFNHRKDGKWEVKVRQRNSGDVQTELADYVFIGAGGGAIPLLQKLEFQKVNIWADSYYRTIFNLY